MADALTPGATARLLGVSPSTLRSWDRRYGVGPRERSPGGHRRYSPADVARLRELCRLVGEGLSPASAAECVLVPARGGPASAAAAAPRVPRQRGAGVSREGGGLAQEGPGTGREGGEDGGEGAGTGQESPQSFRKGSGTSGEDAGNVRPGAEAPGRGARSRWRPGGDTLPLGPAGPTLQGIARAAMRMDAELVERLLEEALDEYGVVAAWEDLAMPLLYGMGRKWEDTRRYVEVEHLLSWCVSSALRRVAAPDGADPAGRPTVLACGPGQMHSLPMEALAAALRERGVPRRVLGPCTPVAATVRAVRRTGPRAVVLWSHAGDADDVAALRAAVRAAAESAQATAVYTAGPGWRSLGAAPGLAAGHLGSLTDAVRTLAPG
ncbi:MerR family transcriptional regulator [Nocardiopsis dassonvillei]|uniref:MerR family transcriptional regulator n=1 Tax=Nocardiopsis dassonvillei TaxID=2014 RepID=UPI0033F7AC18